MKTIGMLIILMTALPLLGNCKEMSPSIKDVKKQHEAQLLTMPGVVSVGIGLNPKGQQAITVGMKGPNPDTEMKIPPSIDGYPVVVQFIGPIKAQ